jgi:hypothetical protein
MDNDSLYASADRLFTLLDEHHIAHVLVGGLALLFHAEARNTEYVDLIVELPDLSALPDPVMHERNEWFARAALYESDLALLLLAQRVDDEPLLAGLRPHLIESDIHALVDVLRDVRGRMEHKF